MVDQAFAAVAKGLRVSVDDLSREIASEGLTRADVVLETYTSGPVAEAAARVGGRYVGPAAVAPRGGGDLISRIERAALEAEAEAAAVLIAKEAIPIEAVEREEALQVLRIALWKTAGKYDNRTRSAANRPGVRPPRSDSFNARRRTWAASCS